MAETKPILVIEDDEGVRQAIGFALELEGFQVSVALNGEEGLNQLESGQEFGLILLDLMMPVMDGWEFLAAFRLQRLSKAIPVMVMSALDERTHRPEGVAGFLSKPIQLEVLLDVASRYCKREMQGAPFRHPCAQA